MKNLLSDKLIKVSIAIFIFAILLSLTNFAPAYNAESANNSYKIAVEEQTDDFYVNDFANLFSDEEKQVMMEKAVQLSEDYDGVQVVVTTVNSLNGYEIEQYAYSMYEQYGIGKDSMGILILLSVEDRNVKIETGKTMQVYITDSKSGQLLDKYGMDYFREDKFSEGLVAVQGAVISEIRDVVPVDWNSEADIEKEESTPLAVSESNNIQQISPNTKMGVIDTMFAVLFFAALVFIFTFAYFYYKVRAKYIEETEGNTKLSNQLKEAQKQKEELSQQVTNLNAELDEKRSSFEKKNGELNKQLSAITKQNNTLSQQVSDMQDFYARVCKLHPECDFEQEVEEMKKAEFEAAVSELNKQIDNVINLPADKDRIDTFDNVIKAYESAKPDIRDAVTSDIEKVRRLRTESINLYKRAKAVSDAEKLEQKINEALNIPESKVTIEALQDVVRAYDSADALTRNFVKADIKNVKSMLEMLLCKRAAKKAEEGAENAIRTIYGSADEDDRHKISIAFDYYHDLSRAEREFFSSDLLNKMRRLKQEADDDHDHQERRRAEERRRREEERRRRDAFHSSSHYSSGSFGGGSHHSGFGGHSSGGGASRHF